MDLISKSPRTPTKLHHMSKKWMDHRNEQSPERNKVWIEPNNNKQRRVAVVYYLTRNGQLEHPHFVEVPLLSSDGLFLRDVINRLTSLRGNGMAALYSWSSKRSYKNGFVWHDLSENDFIYPAHGHDYILKGSEHFNNPAASITSKSHESISPPNGSSKRSESWTGINLNEYKVYSCESSSALRVAADAATQTDETRRQRRAIITELENGSFSELSRNDVSPPPSDSSPETLESLMKTDDKVFLRSEINDVDPTVENKTKAQSVLMQLITCGSISFRDCGPGVYVKEKPAFFDGTNYEVTRGGENGVVLGRKNIKGKKVLEDKEYFSGSIIMQTKKDEFHVLKRSNSYNANG